MWYLVVIYEISKCQRRLGFSIIKEFSCQMAVDDDRWGGGGDAVLVLEATDEAFAEYVKDHGVNNSWTIHR